MYELKLTLKFGSTVVIENVGEEISRKLYPLFVLAKRKHMGGRRHMTVNLDKSITTIDSNFKMYITSVSKNPDFGAELSLLTNFINFSVTMEAFEAQILGLILQELEQELDKK